MTIRSGQAPVFYQSVHEQNFLILCRTSTLVSSVRWEPFTLAFYDHIEEREATYTPDYLVEIAGHSRTRRMLVEVKTLRDYRRTRDSFAAKYRAAERWAEIQPDSTFKVATDKWMEEVGLANFKLMDAVRDRVLNDDYLRIVRQEILKEKGLTLASIFERAISRGVPSDLVMPVVLKLAHQGLVGFDVRRPLTMETTFDDRALAQAFR